MFSPFILVAVVAVQIQTTPVAGSISGVVVNASQARVPVPEAEVVLRVEIEGQLVVAAEGLADKHGRFVFDNIPADADYVYLPGANREGVHYPASRMRLSPQQPHVRVELAIHDTVSVPNPLVVRRHDITIRPESNALHVTEVLMIENASSRTYVGQPTQAGGRATTLGLSIPPDFRRTTFEKEFYGRQFTLIEDRLVTDIPWTPGRRELSFSYVLPNADRHRIWQRQLDLPCDQIRIEVHTDTASEISCNLAHAGAQLPGAIVFESTGDPLPANHLVRLQLGSLPISLGSYGRWLALAVLVGLIGGATGLARTRASRARSDG